MKARTLFKTAIVAGTLMFSAQLTLAQDVRITSNVSPYLHLTRSEFRRNSFFPAYQAIVQPEVQRRALAQQQAFRARIPAQNLGRPAFVSRPPVRSPLRSTIQRFLPTPLPNQCLTTIPTARPSVQLKTPLTLSSSLVAAQVYPPLTTGHTAPFRNLAGLYGQSFRR